MDIARIKLITLSNKFRNGELFFKALSGVEEVIDCERNPVVESKGS